MRRLSTCAIVGIGMVSLAALSSQAQTAESTIATNGVKPAQGVRPVHLVGHEDIELLDRVQDLIDDWDPRKLTNPIVETSQAIHQGRIVKRHQLKRPDLAEFIADVEAAEVLGKALFWEMQAGSDFRRLSDGRYIGTACASCHYRFGADARNRHTTRIPYVVWKKYKLHPDHDIEPFAFGEKRLDYNVRQVATHDRDFNDQQFGRLSRIFGSAGVEPRYFHGLKADNPMAIQPGQESEVATPRNRGGYAPDEFPEWSMFAGRSDTEHFRQITARNSPTVINSGFADRLFHDGRAESTFNGFNIFGDRDQNTVLHRSVRRKDANGNPIMDENGQFSYHNPVAVHVAITKAALASQAVGPIVNDVEMSYIGRSFPNLACKLLDAPVLGAQQVDPHDSLLGPWSNRIGKEAADPLVYRALIKQAFRQEWWDDGGTRVPLMEFGDSIEDRLARGSMMEANFSLYWGLSIMIYEASLVSNQSPFDAMMLGNPHLVNERWEREKPRFDKVRLDRVQEGVNHQVPPFHASGTSLFQHGFRVFMRANCIECHSGPLFSETFERDVEDEPFPIYEQLSNMLFPVSQSEAIAIKRGEFHEATLNDIAKQLTDAHVEPNQHEAKRRAIQLDRMREQARGDGEILALLVESNLGQASTRPENLAKEIAQNLMNFEKTAAKHYGARPFFDEEQRVALAEQIVDPVLVEQMVIPPSQWNQRLHLSLMGTLEENYAFYDLGFYAIGLSPPRYDRGIGARRELPPRQGDPLQQLIEQFTNNPPVNGPETKTRINSENIIRTAKRFQLQLSGSKAPIEVTRDMIDELNEAMDLQTPERVISQPNGGLTGLAYLPRRQYASIDAYKLETPGNVGARTCRDGPRQDLEAPARFLFRQLDSSWDRIDIPANVRRSSLYFFSRARTLVSDEEPWGFRKPLLGDNEILFWGAFKTPSLRNIELTGPYMHNGNLQTLEKVIEFYAAGGDIELDKELYPDKNPEIVPLDLPINDRVALEFFLLCLTDERVRREQAPFDHPSLRVVNGYDSNLDERIVEVNAVGASGSTEAQPPSFPAGN